MTEIKNRLDYKEEESKLKNTIDIMEKEIVSSQQSVDNLTEEMRRFNPATDNMGLFYAMEETQSIYVKKIRDYENNKSNPYFASIDLSFKDGKDADGRYYIGKCSVSGKNGVSLEVIDWRTPIASVYYDGRLGEVSYDAPQGTIDCVLTNKRMYEIEKGTLLDYSDVDITANDELLKPYLNASSDARLKNIISTIQTEQNKIIRANLRIPLIVQGVAGSGKTTAALHRIAYLAYDNEKDLKPSDFTIIAPNKLFLDYISEILPDLGVDNVNQLTFEEFARAYLELKFNLKSSNAVLLSAIEASGGSKENRNVLVDIAALKGSFKYKEAVDKFLDKIEEISLPDVNLSISDIVILSKDEIFEIYRNAGFSKTTSMDDKFKLFLERLSFQIERNYSKIEESIISRRNQKLEELKSKKLSEDEMFNERIKVFDEYEYADLLKNNAKKLIAKYAKLRKKKNALQYYADFISNIEEYLTDCDTEVIDALKKAYKESKGQLDIEDLPAIMYIKKKLDGKNEKHMAKHIVIDEAQDYSPFQLYILREILDNNSMTILGDIAQGIYSYRGTNDWDYINDKIFAGKADIAILDKSYRTTVEIMNLGNKIIENVDTNLKFTKAVPVIRNGSPVEIKAMKSFNDTVNAIHDTLNKLALERKNIAIITKNFDEAKRIHKALTQKSELDIQLVSEKIVDYKGGIIVLPSYLSKGLEFDSVIISNANDKLYLQNEMDAKLLYVAVTRAMHTLNVFYTDNLTRLIS